MATELNAFLHTDLKPLVGGDGLLKDLEIAIKDNIAVKGWPLTAGSKILEGYISPYNATVITKLKDAGATLVGKTNLDEFAMGSSTENSAYGVTKNPWDKKRVPGGSSGGSAAAVAADMCEVALGSDTGGSIRQPAAFCGVTGLKPTYGAVSRYGLVALASSLDVIGPIARSAEAVERVFKVVSGADNNDQTTFSYSYKPISTELSKLRIGLPKELWQLEIDPEIRAAVEKVIEFFVTHGATVSDVSLPTLPYALPAYYVILPAEASANLSRYDGIRFRASDRSGNNLLETYLKTRAKFGKEVKRRLILGTFALSVGHYDAYYATAVRVKKRVEAEHEKVFQTVDLLLSPTTPSLPFEIGTKVNDPVEMYKSDLLTVGANLAGVPAISMPCGFSRSNLPIGVQLIAATKREDILLSVAKLYQEETDYHLRKPEL